MDAWPELRSPAVPVPGVPQEPLKVFLGDMEVRRDLESAGRWKGLKPERLVESIISSLPKISSF